MYSWYNIFLSFGRLSSRCFCTVVSRAKVHNYECRRSLSDGRTQILSRKSIRMFRQRTEHYSQEKEPGYSNICCCALIPGHASEGHELVITMSILSEMNKRIKGFSIDVSPL